MRQVTTATGQQAAAVRVAAHQDGLPWRHCSGCPSRMSWRSAAAAAVCSMLKSPAALMTAILDLSANFAGARHRVVTHAWQPAADRSQLPLPPPAAADEAALRPLRTPRRSGRRSQTGSSLGRSPARGNVGRAGVGFSRAGSCLRSSHVGWPLAGWAQHCTGRCMSRSETQPLSRSCSLLGGAGLRSAVTSPGNGRRAGNAANWPRTRAVATPSKKKSERR
jgi:hypothetical protein